MVIKKDSRVDDYINNSPEFAKPILQHIRQLIHKACPQVTETIKWNFPVFEYHRMMCYLTAFKKHCVFGFWVGNNLPDSENIIIKIGKTDMGHIGKLTSKDDLPIDEILIQYIHEAMKLNEEK